MEEPRLAISLLGNWIFVWILVVSETEGAISLLLFFSLSTFAVCRRRERYSIAISFSAPRGIAGTLMCGFQGSSWFLSFLVKFHVTIRATYD